jgi:hypothetical protein
MKKSVLIILCLLIFGNVVFADPIQATKTVTVCPIYINNAGTTFDKDLEAKLVETINSTLSNSYSLVKNDTYKEDFEKLQIKDLTKAEKVDIVEVFKNKADYVVIAEIEPIVNENKDGFLTQKVTSKGSLQLRIVDVNNNKYLTNENISYQDRDSQLSVSYLSMLKMAKKPITMRNLEKVFKQAAEKIASTIPNARTSEINDANQLKQGNVLAEKGQSKDYP